MGSEPATTSAAKATPTALVNGYRDATITALDHPDAGPIHIRVWRSADVDTSTWQTDHLEPHVRGYLDTTAAATGRYQVDHGQSGSYTTTWIAEHGNGRRTAHVVHNERGTQLAVYLAEVPCGRCRPTTESTARVQRTATHEPIPPRPSCAQAADHAAQDAATARGHTLQVAVPDSGDVTHMTRAARAAAKRVTNAHRLYAHTVELLEPGYDLFTPERGEHLGPRQIQALLSSVDGDDELFDVSGEDWVYGRQADTIDFILDTLLDDDERDELDHHDLLDPLRDEIRERDTSEPALSLLKHSPSTLIRFDLEVDVPPAPTSDGEQYLATLAEVAEAAGLDTTAPAIAETLDELLVHAFNGGRLYALWYGDPWDAYQLANPSACRSRALHPAAPVESVDPVAVRFNGAYLLVLDRFQGTGHEVRIESFTVPWAPDRVSIDAAQVGPGYSWTDVSGPHQPAYSAEVTTLFPTIAAPQSDRPTCSCGNTVDGDGFRPVDENGAATEPARQDRTDNLMCCARCGLLYDITTYDPRHGVFTVVGRLVQADQAEDDAHVSVSQGDARV